MPDEQRAAQPHPMKPELRENAERPTTVLDAPPEIDAGRIFGVPRAPPQAELIAASVRGEIVPWVDAHVPAMIPPPACSATTPGVHPCD